MLEQAVAWLGIVICLTVMAIGILLMLLFGIYHLNPELWHAIKNVLKHKHKFHPPEVFEDIPHKEGGSTSFGVLKCKRCSAVRIIGNFEGVNEETKGELLDIISRLGWEVDQAI